MDESEDITLDIMAVLAKHRDIPPLLAANILLNLGIKLAADLGMPKKEIFDSVKRIYIAVVDQDSII